MRRKYLGVVGVLAAAAAALLVPAAGQAASTPAALAWSEGGSTLTPYSYGTLDAGATASQTFTLTNSGGRASAALTVALTGSSAFSISSDSCTATSLGPAKSCQVTVAYSPSAAGASDGATLTVTGMQAPATSLNLAGSGASSTGNVYWVDQFSGDWSVGTVNRISPDGSGMSTIATVPPGPWAVAVYGTNVYWVDSVGVYKAQVSGDGNVTTLASGQYSPDSVAVDGTNVYWSDSAGVHQVPVAGGNVTEGAYTDVADGVLVNWLGSGHGALGQSACATQSAQNFLVNGKVPANPTTCPP